MRVMDVHNCSPTEIDAACDEIAILCRVAERLGASVVELKGFVLIPGSRILVVMEVLRGSLATQIRDAGGKLPLHEAVRFRVPKYRYIQWYIQFFVTWTLKYRDIQW